MIDTHAHIYLPEFLADRHELLQRARQAGVKKIFLPNIDQESIDLMLQLCNDEPGYCFPMMGLHPCSVTDHFEMDLKLIEDYLKQPASKFYGVGECGLDYYWDRSLIDQQKEAFEFQIQLAKKYQLPVIIHSRDAVDDCIGLIAKHKDEHLTGIFHCFSGTKLQLEQIIELDFYAGIGGVVTFKNGGLDQVLEQQHLDHLVLETDSPYLAPVPFRGKRNEPAYLSFVVSRLSELLNISEIDVEQITTFNAEKCFKIQV